MNGKPTYSIIDEETIQIWIKSCVRTYNWTPHYCKRLYLDDADVFGLKFWYLDSMEVDKSIRQTTL